MRGNAPRSNRPRITETGLSKAIRADADFARLLWCSSLASLDAHNFTVASKVVSPLTINHTGSLTDVFEEEEDTLGTLLGLEHWLM